MLRHSSSRWQMGMLFLLWEDLRRKIGDTVKRAFD
jgi:hypothetical protein